MPSGPVYISGRDYKSMKKSLKSKNFDRKSVQQAVLIDEKKFIVLRSLRK
jgi:hypothetical protein